MRLLKSAGYLTKTFPSAEAFLSDMSEQDGGCLVLDINLPGMTGFELQEALIERGLTYQIIFMTAYDNKRWEAKAEKRRSSGYLKKPFDEKALLDVVSECRKQVAEMNLHQVKVPR